MGIFSSMMAGAGEINLSGSLDGGAFFSPEFAVFDNEIMAYLRSFKKGFVVDRDHISLEAIARGMDRGEYLKKR